MCLKKYIYLQNKCLTDIHFIAKHVLKLLITFLSDPQESPRSPKGNDLEKDIKAIDRKIADLGFGEYYNLYKII